MSDRNFTDILAEKQAQVTELIKACLPKEEGVKYEAN